MIDIFTKSEWSNQKYAIGIANTASESDEVYRLRYDIFNIELNEGIKENERTLRDMDKFDPNCDHLIIKDTASGKIIATYRIHPSWNMHKDGFYTSTEFNISKLGLEKKRSIEVGRACVHPEHRGNNMLVTMMWVGIRKYCEKNNVEYLFGVASIPKCSIEELSSLYSDLLKKGALIDDGKVTPLPDQKAQLVSDPPGTYRKELVSSLLKGYIKMGAKLMGQPVFDPVFRCYDFFVLLEMRSVNWTYVDSFSKMLNTI
ncbi:MAG: GNAT family N-acyltransferase [Pseudomonadota bacterium]